VFHRTKTLAYMEFSKEQLDQCKENHAGAQRALYYLFKSRVMGLCRRYTKNREEAEDVFQEAFIRVFQNIKQLNDIGNLTPWIKRIAVNAAVNYYHKQKRHHHYSDYLDYDNQNDDYELMVSQLDDEALIGLINDLPDGYRLVFNLNVVEGYSHAEIGDMLNISEVTSRSQLNRAKQTLKNKLKALGVLKYEKYA
jgi:RNA polymerase sigma factor (sigma-70 family)